ncbi:MAG: DNA-processing protein DprA [Actinomycetota bacterium]
MPVDRPPSWEQGFPEGFGVGPAEREAALLLRCLLGIMPRALHELAWREGSACFTVAAIVRGAAGSDLDRAFLHEADLARIRASLTACGARFAAPGDDDYWPAFVRLADPPVGVFVRGERLDPGDVRVAVIGSRRPSALGRDVAIDLGRGLVRAGAVVVSGGAIGIDAAAHLGALDAAGRTVAVLGSGIDVAYPASNRVLLERIPDAGTVISEYPPGVPAEPFRFPARNRLIAALSRAVVVVEGAAQSGTRITAECATDLGLDVFAVPGPVTSPLAETPLALIRDGARMIRGADDLLADLDLAPVVAARAAPVGLPPDEQRAFDALEVSMLPDALARSAAMSLSEAVGALIRLELRGLVRGVGGRYERTFGRGPVGEANRSIG